MEGNTIPAKPGVDEGAPGVCDTGLCEDHASLVNADFFNRLLGLLQRPFEGGVIRVVSEVAAG